jgi:hypothetical protein
MVRAREPSRKSVELSDVIGDDSSTQDASQVLNTGGRMMFLPPNREYYTNPTC